MSEMSTTTETAPLDLLAAYDAGPRYDLPDGRTARLTTVQADGGHAWIVLSRGGGESGEAILRADGTIATTSGYGVSAEDARAIGEWLAAGIRYRLGLRDQTIAALEHLDRIAYRAGSGPLPWLADVDLAVYATASRGEANLFELQHHGIGMARVADLIRSGVLIPVIPS